MLGNSARVKQVTPISEQDAIISNTEWLASLLAQTKTEFIEETREVDRSRSSRTGLSDSDRMQIIGSLLSNTQLKEVCTSPLSIASLLRHTSITSLLAQDVSDGLDLSLEASADTLPAITEISFLIKACNEEVYNTFLHPVHGYASLLRQRHSLQHKLESLADYSRACCSITNAILHLISYRINTILTCVEQKYFQ